MRASTNDLINLSNFLGYPLDIKGLCWGFSLTFAQAILANDENSFFERLDLIAQYKNDFNKLIFDIERAKEELSKRQNQKNDEDNEDIKKYHQLIDIPIFFGTLNLYHNPMEYSKTLFNDEYIDQSSFHKVYDIVKPVQLDKENLSVLLNKNFLFDRKILHAYLSDIEAIFNYHLDAIPSGKLEIPILLTSKSHSVCVKYDNVKKKWDYVDTKSGLQEYVKELSTEELVSNIFHSFTSGIEHVAFNTTLLATTKPNDDPLSAVLTEMSESFKEFNLRYAINSEYLGGASLEELLTITCQWGDLETIELLLKDKFIDINDSRTAAGATLLSEACHYRKENLVQLLLNQENVNVNLGGTQPPPLYIACATGMTNIVKLLLDARANINIQSMLNSRQTPLHAACLSPYTKNNLELFKLLLSKNPDISVRNTNGQRALDLAFANQNEIAISMLLEYARLNKHIPASIMSPLIFEEAIKWAKKNNKPDLLEYLGVTRKISKEEPPAVQIAKLFQAYIDSKKAADPILFNYRGRQDPWMQCAIDIVKTLQKNPAWELDKCKYYATDAILTTMRGEKESKIPEPIAKIQKELDNIQAHYVLLKPSSF